MAIMPQTDEELLASLPQYGGAGGSQQAADYYAGKDFFDFFGRNPTRSELATLSNYYIGGDPNIANTTGGRSAVAQYYQDQSNLPANRRERYGQDSGKYSGDIQSIYQDLMKRGATEDEVKHFGTLLASGELDPYELRSFIQATPEYQNQQDTAFRSQVGGELADLDAKAFGRQKEDVISRFSKMGRQGSTALDFALTDLMGKVAEKRQAFLSNLSASQYGSNKENARADYGQILNQMGANQDRTYGLNDTYRTRGWNVSDYNRQQQDWLSALKASQKKPGWMDYTAFGLDAINSLTNTGKNVATAGGKSGFGMWG